MDHTAVRRLVLRGICSSPLLVSQLVLKGGNALAMIYDVGGRTSLDLDFSIASDFKDSDAANAELERALVWSFPSTECSNPLVSTLTT